MDSESSDNPRRRHSPGLQQKQTTDDGLASQSLSHERAGFPPIFSLGNDGAVDNDILHLSTVRAGTLPAVARSASSTMAFAKRSTTPTKFASTGKGGVAAGVVTQEQDKAWATYRRYRVGDSVLVCNTQSRYANLVNRWGYPSGGGVTPEERRGPYIYVLATVKKVHFEEDAEYYTVTRADTGLDQRADAGKSKVFLFIFAED